MSETAATGDRAVGGRRRSDGARRRPIAQLASLALTCPVLLGTVGWPGVGIWLAIALSWYVLETPVAIGVGIVGLIAAPSYTFTLGLTVDAGLQIDPQLAWLAPLALFGLAVTDWTGTASPKTAALATTVATATLVLGSSLVLAGSALPLWAVATALIGLVGVGAVGIARYERLVVDTLEFDSDDSSRSGSESRRESEADSSNQRSPTRH